MGNDKWKKKKGKGRRDGGGEKEVITDARFASVHTDPRFQNIARRERKVSIDPRFDKMFTDRNFGSSAAPVDKRGRRKEQKENPLKRYYELEDEKKKKKKKKNEDDDGESEGSEKEEGVKIGGGLSKVESEDEEDGVQVSDESVDMEELSDAEIEIDTDDDEMLIGESDSESEEQEEEVPEIDQETSRLAAVNLDWHHIKAVDLYALLNSFLPDGGRIRSVTVYPSEFGLERMKEEAVRGPVGLFDDDKNTVKNVDEESSDSDSDNQNEEDGVEEDASLDASGDEIEDGSDNSDDEDEEEDEEDEEEEEEEDKDYIADRVRNYEKTRLRYYFAVVCCDSVATANHLYKECDGIEIMQSSNKLDLRYIPDSMEFKQEARDAATEVPSGYKPSDFFTKALQLSNPTLTWDEDEPERAILKRNFNADELEKLEFNEFLASDESDSDDEDDGQDMEVTFNTNLEDISKRILKKRDTESETVWERHLRERREKRKAKKSIKDSGNESDDDSDDGFENDDFFNDGPKLKKHKGDVNTKSSRKGTDNAEVDKKAGASRAELDLLLADDEATDSNVKGYKIKLEKVKGKKGKEVADGQKIPEADLDDPRFQSLLKNPLFSMDPTDPQFRRSAAYLRQLAEKQKKAEQDDLLVEDVTKSSNQAQLPSDDVDKTSKPTPYLNGNAYKISSMIKSIKMKSKEANRKGKSDTESVARSLKKKTKHLMK